MHKLITLVAFCVLLQLATTGAVGAAHVKVVLLGGQSNMNGRGLISGLPTTPVDLQQPQTDVLLFSDGHHGSLAPTDTLTTLRPVGRFAGEFGPEVTFGRTIADARPTDTFALLKDAAAGTNLAVDWNPSAGASYTAFRSTVAAGLTALTSAGHTYDIAGMIWMQGESDARNTIFANAYEANLTAFIADVRTRYGADLPFVIGQLSSSQTDLEATNLATVRTAQANVAVGDANVGLLVTDSFSISNDALHFDAAGQIALGEGFAQQYLALTSSGGEGTGNASPEPSAGLLAMLAIVGVSVTRQRKRNA